jgi:Protein of unknown function (DUF3015)
MKNAILKGLLVAGIASMSVAPMLANAQEFGAYGSAGCGVGSMLIGNTPGIVQIFAATTNGILFNQTLGITSGTSNCRRVEVPIRRGELQHSFVALNMDNLSKDAAAGGGEYLSAFGTILGCEAGARSDLFKVSKEHHGDIFTAKADADTVLANFKTVLAQNEKLSSCKL